jgi:hypothetical protein
MPDAGIRVVSAVAPAQQSTTLRRIRIKPADRRYFIGGSDALIPRATLDRLKHQIVAEARKHVANLIDEDVTADRMAIIAAMKGASSSLPEEPPPELAP